MWTTINAFLKTVDNFVWGVPLMVLILCGGILLTVRLGVLQMRRLPLALKWMIKNEEGGKGEISSFAQLMYGTECNDRYGKHCRCGNCGMCRRPGGIVLDDCGGIFRNGNKIFRRITCHQISCS